MIVRIAIATGPNHNSVVTKKDIDKNIQALERAISNKKVGADDALIIDTISILESIKSELPGGSVYSRSFDSTIMDDPMCPPSNEKYVRTI